MQRHPALRDLSSDHHLGLVLARRARRASEAQAEARSRAWKEVTTRFAEELEPHFQREEQGLLPAMRAAGQETLVERTLVEHAAMRRLIADDRAEHLARFAELLKAHIHFEEKALFETAQRVLTPEQLAGLGGAGAIGTPEP